MLRLSLAAALVCSSVVFAQDAGSGPSEAAAPAAAPVDYAAKLDELWKTRDDPASIKATNEAITDALTVNAQSYDILWRAARFRWWTADGMPPDAKRKVTAKAAWEYADRALRAKSDGFEGHYYKALSIGAYSQAIGILTALSEGVEGQFNEHLDLAIKQNGCYDRAGPYRAKGRYYFELPWPKRDLDKSKDMLDKAVKCAPEALRTQYFLADTLLKDGDKKKAKEAIDKAINGDIAFDPPEGRRVKAWAKPLAEKIADELK
jgi:tetratricopeptide (TPR) repeat protein